MSLKAPRPVISFDERDVPSPSVPSPADPTVADRHLLDRIARGDVAALNVVLGRYWAPVLGYLAALLGSHDAAEDVAQETFCRLWERRDQIRVDGSLRGFLFQVAHNLAITERRRVRTRARSLEALRSEEHRFSLPVDIGGDELDASLERAIGALTARRREILLLRSVHGLSYKEIASALGIAPQTVGNQFSAALSSLRRSLAHLLP